MPPSSGGSLTVAVLTAASFVVLLGVVTWLARVRRVPLPFTPPRLPVVAGWVAAFVVVAVLEEVVSGYLGGEAAPLWDALTPARAVRAATIVLLAPLAEEVAFRGTIFGNLRKKGASPAVAILATAALFAAAHLQYWGPGLVVVLADGVLFGLARHRTGSLFVPVLLHTLGNAYAVAERVLG